MNKKAFQIAGYVLFTILALVFFVYQTFPIEAVQGRISKELEKQYPQAHVSFDKASPYRLSGLDIEDLSVTIEQPGDKPALSLSLDRVRARLQLLPLLRKHYDVAFDITLGDGSISGVVSTSADALGVQVDINDVDLAHPPLIGKLLGANLTGELSGKIDLVLDSNDPKKSSGGGSLELKKAAVSETVVNNLVPTMPGPFTFPATQFGALTAQVEMKDGTLQVKKFEQKSEDLEIKLTGDVTLKKIFNQSNLNLVLVYKLSDSYTQKNGKMALLAMKKGADGFSKVTLGGTVLLPAPQM